jgi:hypothetical protein
LRSWGSGWRGRTRRGATRGSKVLCRTWDTHRGTSGRRIRVSGDVRSRTSVIAARHRAIRGEIPLRARKISENRGESLGSARRTISVRLGGVASMRRLVDAPDPCLATTPEARSATGGDQVRAPCGSKRYGPARRALRDPDPLPISPCQALRMLECVTSTTFRVLATPPTDPETTFRVIADPSIETEMCFRAHFPLPCVDRHRSPDISSSCRRPAGG